MTPVRFVCRFVSPIVVALMLSGCGTLPQSDNFTEPLETVVVDWASVDRLELAIHGDVYGRVIDASDRSLGYRGEPATSEPLTEIPESSFQPSIGGATYALKGREQFDAELIVLDDGHSPNYVSITVNAYRGAETYWQSQFKIADNPDGTLLRLTFGCGVAMHDIRLQIDRDADGDPEATIAPLDIGEVWLKQPTPPLLQPFPAPTITQTTDPCN